MELGSEFGQLRKGAVGAASAGTAVTGATLDMQNFEGVLIFMDIATANAGNFLKAQQGEASDLSDAADIAGSKVVADADASVVMIDLNRPKERYVRGVCIRAGANTVTGTMYYWQYNGNNRPTLNQIANVLKTVALKTPAEGTP